MTPSSTAFPHVTAVCLLQAYADAHDKGNAGLKSAMWSLNKARRQRGNGTRISAVDVREELRARAVLRESTPDLTVEGDTATTEYKEQDYFELVDTVEVIAEMRGEKENVPATQTNAAGGLRRRKAHGEEDTKQEWTAEDSPNEDDRLRSADPVDLFGAFPPRDLLDSQREVRQALAGYIEAANLARAILEVTNDQKK